MFTYRLLNRPLTAPQGYCNFASPNDMKSDLDKLIDSAFSFSTDSKLKLSEDDVNYFLHLDLPGYKNSEIDVSVEDSVLFIKAENKNRGVFTRSTSLWKGLDEGKISGKVEDGVLTITLPKIEKEKPKIIKIN